MKNLVFEIKKLKKKGKIVNNSPNQQFIISLSEQNKTKIML